MEKVDYLIVGQGIAGSLLAFELLKAGKTIHILNEEKEHTSSMKAGGLYNPVTGKTMVKTWLADELFLDLENYYRSIEEVTGENFLFSKPIYRPFFNYAEQNDWSAKADLPEFSPFIRSLLTSSLGIPDVEDPFGGLLLNLSGHLELPIMLPALRKYFISKGSYTAEVFQYDQLILSENGVKYKGLEAEQVFFCEGPDAAHNPFWNWLPFRPVKGETLKIKVALDDDKIINRGVFILPKNGAHTVGATYDHKRLDYEPSVEGISQLKDRLEKVYKGKYEVISTSAGVRPATFDRRPFIGIHPDHAQVGVFNGFGTKGVSLVPFFAAQLVSYLKGDGEIMPEADIKRVSR